MRRVWLGASGLLGFLIGGYFLGNYYTTHARWEVASYADLPGWHTADLRPSLDAFQISCRWLLKRSPERNVGNKTFPLIVKDWLPVCQKALNLDKNSPQKVKAFFEQTFMPVHWTSPRSKTGLFTGYFSPIYPGNLEKTTQYTVPIYSLPTDLIKIPLTLFDPKLPNRTLIGRIVGQQVRPYYTRAEIDKRAMRAQALVWLKDEIDRVVLEIQGAGLVQLPNGQQVALGYAGENGAPYRSIAKALIDRGVFTKDTASMQHIRQYVKTHPAVGRAIINYNPSFVFFSKLPHAYTPSSLGYPLTPGYSMAVDKTWVPLGVPVWIDTQQPQQNTAQTAPLQRLMIAQDVGGAIKGKVRGDIFWGVGEQASHLAEHTKYTGNDWLLLPRTFVNKRLKK